LLNKALGAATLIAGGVILSLAINEGYIATCGKWTGCTSWGDSPQGFADVAIFFLAGGIGLVALGIFFLASRQNSKRPFGKADQGMI
jgi:hypothetical protein